MYATTRRYEGVKDPVGFARKVQEGFVPLLEEIPGFIAYYWVDAGNGVAITTSVFDSKESADESNKRAVEWLHNLSPLPTGTQVTCGEVLATSVRQVVMS